MQTFDALQVTRIVGCHMMTLKAMRARVAEKEAELECDLPSGTGFVQRYTWDDVVTTGMILAAKRGQEIDEEVLNFQLTKRAIDLGILYPINLEGANGRLYRPSRME
jgi:hypothetical protein